jgi:2-keto-4-pentenoate hydratase/2-oxohepta-3-ene-1,7-dioic acid hydratase in catechol pathway
MRIATYLHDGASAVGLVAGESILDLMVACERFGAAPAPESVLQLIAGGDAAITQARNVLEQVNGQVGDTTLWRPLSEVRLLAPIPRPAKNVFCTGRNYKLHIEEGAREQGIDVKFPPVPEFFTKPPTAVIGPEAEIRLDTKLTKALDYEVEFAIVVGRECRDVKASEALDVVFGYTVLNDVSARDLQRAHGQWFKGKALDTSCPIGPWIVTADEFGSPNDVRLTLRVNGQTRQDLRNAHRKPLAGYDAGTRRHHLHGYTIRRRLRDEAARSAEGRRHH